MRTADELEIAHVVTENPQLVGPDERDASSSV